MISRFTNPEKKEVKEFVLSILKKFGFAYNQKYHYDLENPKNYYMDSGGVFYVLKLNNKVVGTIAILNKGKTAELKRFYVAEDLREQGFGSILFKKATEFCQKNKFCTIEIVTDKCFKAAHLFYHEKGFKIVKEDNERLYMEKQL